MRQGITFTLNLKVRIGKWKASMLQEKLAEKDSEITALKKQPVSQKEMIDNFSCLKDKDKLDILHREIHHEHGLISNRMNWYAASQVFLMSAFAVAGSNMHHFPWLAKWFLPPLGIVLSLTILPSIIAALLSMWRLRKEEFMLISKSEELKGVPFAEITPLIHWFGMAPSVLIPIFFILAWIIAWVFAARSI